MLILAGVSLNAIIGDNGVITNAQNANLKSGMVELEEWLQEEYINYSEYAEDYNSKVELLADKKENLFFKDGSRKYITYNGNIYYLINKNLLPKNIKEKLYGGNTTEFYKYIRLIDVYGVTEDLKVYYCEDGLTGNIYGNIETVQQDPTAPAVKLNSNGEFKNLVSNVLSTMGINVGDENITVDQASKIKEITIDGTVYTTLRDLSGITELRNLKKIILKDLDLNNIDGLANCIYLEYISFNNTRVGDYKGIANSLNLKYLYLNKPIQSDIDKLVSGLKKSPMENIQYFAIRNRDSIEYLWEDHRTSDTNDKSTVVNLSKLDDLPKNIKESIKYLYLNDNAFSSLIGISSFSNVVYLDLKGNHNLIDINDIISLNKLETLILCCCKNLNDISPLANALGIIYLYMDNTAVEKIYCSSKTLCIYANGCKIKDLEYLNNNVYIRRLELKNILTLIKVNSLKNCSGITTLYLAGNENMDIEEFRSIENIFEQCEGDYSFPTKYLKYLSSVTSYSYSNFGLDDYSEEIMALKYRTNVKSLNLSSNSNLGKSRILMLYKLGKIKKVDLDNILDNLILSQSEITYITNLKNYTDNQINDFTDAQIAEMEEESDIYLRFILSTMTGLKELRLDSCSNIYNSDFLNKLNNLNVLTVTSTNLIDLSPLDENNIPITTLSVNNSLIDPTKIQKTISRCSSFYCYSHTLLSKIGSSCSEITALHLGGGIWGGDRIDLTGCTSLGSISTTENFQLNFIYPCNLKNVTRNWCYHGCNDDYSNCLNIELINLYDGWVSDQNSLENFCCALKTIKCPVKTLSIVVSFNGSFEGVFNAIDFELENLTITGYNWSSTSMKNHTDIEGISKLTSLKSLSWNYASINDISCLKNLTNLTSLTLVYNKISEIDTIKYLVNLKNLNLSNNILSNVSSLDDMNNLEYLYLNENQIENTINIKNSENEIIVIDNIEILKKLKQNGVLKVLEIKNNLLTDDSELKSLNWRGGHYYGL